ncbi:MAG: hypothetical protein ACWGOV_00220 [Acidiferrobacterales bacterium]
MSVLSAQPQTIGKVLDGGIRLYVRGLGKVLPISLVIALIGMVPNYLRFNPGLVQQGDPASLVTLSIGYVVIVVLLGIVIYGAMIKVYGDLGAGKSASVASGLKRGLGKLFPILIAGILYFLAVALGTVLLVIPGVILMLSMYLFSTAIILDDKGIIESLKYSHNLIWGNWWRTAVIFTVPVVIIIGLYVLLGIVLSLVMASMAAGAGSFNPANLSQFSWFIFAEAIINAIIYPLFYAMAVVVYHDLKVRKSGGDLEARLASV